MSDEPSIGELTRQIREVLQRFSELATRLETQYVRGDNFSLYKQIVDQAILGLQSDASELKSTVNRLPNATEIANIKTDVSGKASKSSFDALEERVAELEDDKKWLTRLILGFIILGVLGAVYAASKVGG